MPETSLQSPDPVLMPIRPDTIDIWWPKILPWAEDFCQHSQGSYDTVYILERIRAARMLAWIIMKGEEIFGVCLTEIRITKIKECIIIVCTGRDMASWKHLLPTIEKYATLMECKKIVAVARPGWERIFKPYGYSKTHVQLERDL